MNARSQASLKLPDACTRISHFLKLKEAVADNFWPGFNGKILYGPLLYYSLDGLYTINPNEKLGARIKFNTLEDCISPVFIGKVSDDIDTSRFNMRVDYDEDDSTLLHYFNPIASVSDLPIVLKFVPEVRHIEEWYGMILHESFHQYQTSFDAFKACQNSTQKLLNRDTLVTLYKENEWYRKMVKQEYELLIRAVNARSKDSTRIYTGYFLQARNERLKETTRIWHLDIKALEDMLERSEGVARYMEFCLKRTANSLPTDRRLMALDSLYKPSAYKKYTILKDLFLNKQGSQYVYATGMTLARLLEKLNIPFQENMYRENIPFENYLYTYLKMERLQ